MSGEPPNDIAEVVCASARAAMEKTPVERFLKEIVPIALNGPPSVTGLNAAAVKWMRSRLLARVDSKNSGNAQVEVVEA